MKRITIVVIVLWLVMANTVFAQENELTQRYDDGSLSFDYPSGWSLATAGNHVHISRPTPPPDAVSGKESDLVMMSFVRLSQASEEESWPLETDLHFLAGYVTNDVISGFVDEGDRVEFGTLKEMMIDDKQAVSITFEATELAGTVVLIEGVEDHLMLLGITSSRTFSQWDNTYRLIAQSVKYGA